MASPSLGRAGWPAASFASDTRTISSPGRRKWIAVSAAPVRSSATTTTPDEDSAPIGIIGFQGGLILAREPREAQPSRQLLDSRRNRLRWKNAGAGIRSTLIPRATSPAGAREDGRP